MVIVARIARPGISQKSQACGYGSRIDARSRSLVRDDADLLPPLHLPPDRKIRLRLLVGGRIKPEDATPSTNLLGHKILERGHLKGLVGDFLGKMRGDYDHAVTIAENNVAGKHRCVAAADRHVDF